MLLRYARSHPNIAEPEDIRQEAWLRIIKWSLYRHPPVFDDRWGYIRKIMFNVVRYAALDIRQKRMRQETRVPVLVGADDDFLEQMLGGEEDIAWLEEWEYAVETQVRNMAVLGHLKDLMAGSPVGRDHFLAFCGGENSVQQAKRLGRSPGAVKNSVRRMRRLLKTETLTRQYYEEQARGTTT